MCPRTGLTANRDLFGLGRVQQRIVARLCSTSCFFGIFVIHPITEVRRGRRAATAPTRRTRSILASAHVRDQIRTGLAVSFSSGLNDHNEPPLGFNRQVRSSLGGCDPLREEPRMPAVIGVRPASTTAGCHRPTATAPSDLCLAAPAFFQLIWLWLRTGRYATHRQARSASS